MSRLAESVLPVLARICLWPARVAKARRDLELLSSLDDRGLADIGLSRQDLRDVTALPLSDDPTSHLAKRARERARLALTARDRVPASPAPSARARIA